MKNYLFGLALTTALVACNNTSDTNLKDPATVQPPSEAILDSTRLVNDSLLFPIPKEAMANRLAYLIL